MTGTVSAFEANRLAQLYLDSQAELLGVRHQLAIAEDALEAERQWRLTSLPALLAAEERAVKAEAEVLRLAAVVNERDRVRGYPTTFPELRQTRGNRALADAYHESKERP